MWAGQVCFTVTTYNQRTRKCVLCFLVEFIRFNTGCGFYPWNQFSSELWDWRHDQTDTVCGLVLSAGHAFHGLACSSSGHHAGRVPPLSPAWSSSQRQRTRGAACTTALLSPTVTWPWWLNHSVVRSVSAGQLPEPGQLLISQRSQCRDQCLPQEHHGQR